MRSNRTGHFLPYTLVQIILRWDSKIPHDAAPFANKMIMLIDGRIVPTNSFTKIELADLSLLLEDMQIAVHRPE